jgi:hypothetical protein
MPVNPDDDLAGGRSDCQIERCRSSAARVMYQGYPEVLCRNRRGDLAGLVAGWTKS